MTAKEFFQAQCDVCLKQVQGAFDGTEAGHFDGRLAEATMSPREIAGHLAECYAAAQKTVRGEKHEWGTYPALPEDPKEALAAMYREREAAVAAALSGADEHLLEASDFICLHDAYHVGQLASYRIAKDPGWDPYSIY